MNKKVLVILKLEETTNKTLTMLSVIWLAIQRDYDIIEMY
jgi:hypothetical protein